MFERIQNDVENNGKKYFVSTVYLYDNPLMGIVDKALGLYNEKPYETMIFGFDSNGKVDFSDDHYMERYNDPEEAKERHKYICENISEFVRKED